MKKVSETLAERLKEERLYNNLTQLQMAERLNIPLRTYASYEAKTTLRHRDPDLDMLVKIATILNTTLDYLTGKEQI